MKCFFCNEDMKFEVNKEIDIEFMEDFDNEVKANTLITVPIGSAKCISEKCDSHKKIERIR